MSLTPFLVMESLIPSTPLVVDSPHSGRIYPADFNYSCPLSLLRQAEDFLVDELIAGAAPGGAAVLIAEFPRSFIDANRAENDIDPTVLDSVWPGVLDPTERTLQGLGLVRRLCRSGVPLYKAPLKVTEVERRIRDYYRPYHAALERLVAKSMATFGECYLIDCHSMPGRGGANRASPRPDFVLGDRNGSSCDVSFTRRARDILQDMGYNVALNDPYKGVEIVHRYGRPHLGRHALQLEINRHLYMNEQTLEKKEGFDALQTDLSSFFVTLINEVMSDASERMAAE